MKEKYAELSLESKRSEVERLSGVFSGGIPDSKKLVRNDQNLDLLLEVGVHANA
jgi:hypothetical protein